MKIIDNTMNVPIGSTEAQALVKKISENARFSVDPKTGKIVKKSMFVKAGDLLESLTATRWVVKGLLEADALALIYGAPNDGKSFLTLDFACCVSMGMPWQGHKTQQSPVLYIAGEGHGGISRRLAAWEKHHGVSLKNAPLFISIKAVSLLDPAEAAEIVRDAEEIVPTGTKPGLVVIDTVARATVGANESDAKDMGQFVNVIDQALKNRWGANVLLVHHSGKDATKGARGSSAIRGALDQEFSLEVKGDKGRTKILRCTKMKDAEKPEPINFELKKILLKEVVDQFGDIEVISSLVTIPQEKKNESDESVEQVQDDDSGVTAQVIIEVMLERRALGEKEWPGMNFFVEKMHIGKSRLSEILKRAIKDGLLETVGSGAHLKYIVCKEGLLRPALKPAQSPTLFEGKKRVVSHRSFG